MHVLVLNAGSSSLKFQLIRTGPEQMTGGREGRISADGSRLGAWVLPTDEELVIARDTVRLVLGMDTRY